MRELAVGGFAVGIYVAIKAIRGTVPSPVEWVASAGLLPILWALLPESDPDPATNELATPAKAPEPTTLADWVQIAFNVLVVAMFVASLVLLKTNHRDGVHLFVATVGAGVLCALVNHIRNGPPYPSD
jgi:hypothetical protein